eukprot:g7870.t1
MEALPKAPKPLTEAQRNEVRNLLKQLSAVSASRRSKAGNRNPLSRKKIKKVKRIENPFEEVEEGKTVGMELLNPDCCVMAFVERVKCVLLPYLYDSIELEYKEWIDMIVHYCGCLVSPLDEGLKSHVKFVVEGNAPVRYLHVYFEEGESKSKISNFMFGC